MMQINLLQPGFVVSVGDLIAGTALVELTLSPGVTLTGMTLTESSLRIENIELRGLVGLDVYLVKPLGAPCGQVLDFPV